MEGKKNLLITLMTIFIISTILLGGFIIYDKVLKKDTVPVDNSSETNNEQKENDKLYHIEDGEKFVIYGKTPGLDDQLINRGKEISFAYPVIDINSDEMKKVNNEISKKYQDAYKSDLSSKADGNSCVAVKKNGQYYGGDHILYNTYRIFENTNYLSIVIIDNAYTECAGGDTGYDGYVINKETKKLMTNKEILKLFGAENNEKVFIDKYNEVANIFDYSKINSIEDANILIYDNKLMISIDGNGESLLQYNNGKLEEYYD